MGTLAFANGTPVKRKPLYQPKKKVLSFLIGPPTVKPNSFCLFLVRGALPVSGSGGLWLLKNGLHQCLISQKLVHRTMDIVRSGSQSKTGNSTTRSTVFSLALPVVSLNS